MKERLEEMLLGQEGSGAQRARLAHGGSDFEHKIDRFGRLDAAVATSHEREPSSLSF